MTDYLVNKDLTEKAWARRGKAYLVGDRVFPFLIVALFAARGDVREIDSVVTVPDPGGWILDDPFASFAADAVSCPVESVSTGWKGVAAVRNGMVDFGTIHVVIPFDVWTR